MWTKNYSEATQSPQISGANLFYIILELPWITGILINWVWKRKDKGETLIWLANNMLACEPLCVASIWIQ